MVADQTVAMWILGAIAAYLCYRWLFATRPGPSSHEREMDEILTSEKYKVKGRFED